MMEKKPLLSVVVPIYNVEAYLSRCIESLLGQTYRELEIVLVDDGSTDESGALCDEFAARDSRVRALHQANAGQIAARAAGVRGSAGDYLTFIDGDDYIDEDMLSRLMAPVLRDRSIDIVIGGSCLEKNSDGSILYQHRPMEEQRLTQAEGLLHMYSNRAFAWSLWAKVYRRSLFAEPLTHIDADAYGEDFEENTELFARAHSLYYVPVYGYHYVQRADSCCHTVRASSLIAMARRNIAALERYGADRDIAPVLTALLSSNGTKALYAALVEGDERAFIAIQQRLAQIIPPQVAAGAIAWRELRYGTFADCRRHIDDLMREKRSRLEALANEHVYIYGAGTIGEKVRQDLAAAGAIVEGFIVTKRLGTRQNTPLYSLAEAVEKLGSAITIVVAVNEPNERAIVASLQEQGMKAKLLAGRYYENYIRD